MNMSQNQQNQSIGIFDSGVGGLTVFKAIKELLPNESMLYLGDTARLPYGTKSPETVVKYAVQAAQKLIDRNIKALVIACNTATAAALPTLQKTFPNLPVIGVVKPGASAACKSSKSGHICVIATEGAIRSGAYQSEILKIRPDAVVSALACSLFVPLAEEGWVQGPIAEAVAKEYLKNIFTQNTIDSFEKSDNNTTPEQSSDQLVEMSPETLPDQLLNMSPNVAPDTLVLGCTHFPLLSEAIAKAAGAGVNLVDSAATTAIVLRERLLNEGLLKNPNEAQASNTLTETGNKLSAYKNCGTYHFMTTDDPERFARIGSRFLGVDLDSANVELVDI